MPAATALTAQGTTIKQEESARERALCQLTECFWFVKVIRGQNNYQEKGCTEIQYMVTEQQVRKKF